MMALDPGSRKNTAFYVQAQPLGHRQVRVIVSTDQVDRTGDIVVQMGLDLRTFMLSRSILWQHDQKIPVAECLEIGIKDGRLVALAQFPPVGVSTKADEIYGLIKAGVINAASIGFLPLVSEPVDGKNPRKGIRIDQSELLEFSFVSVPANPGAQIIERAISSRQRDSDDPAQRSRAAQIALLNCPASQAREARALALASLTPKVALAEGPSRLSPEGEAVIGRALQLLAIGGPAEFPSHLLAQVSPAARQRIRSIQIIALGVPE